MTNERRIGIICDGTVGFNPVTILSTCMEGLKKHQNFSQSNWSESEIQARNIAAASDISNL